ncbi:MAG: von Willebrand factor type A domain-containing protein, partial [Opitutaceae bacterium]|nr:von Willebrand factor type A domain-containing protein [Opitutaceae bacterium]
MKHDDSNMKHNDNDDNDRNDSNDPLSNSADASRTPQFSADDPRLTACALGEMDATERAAFETEIRNNPAAQAAIAEIRALAGELETALAAEPLPAAASPAMHSPAAAETGAETETEAWRAAREAEARAARKRERARARANKPFRFPYFLIAGLATACFALVFFTVVKPDYDLQRELKRKQAAAEWELERNRVDAANRLRMQNEQLAFAEAKRDENVAGENVVRYELGLNQVPSPGAPEGAPEQYRPVELPAPHAQVASGNFRSTPAARTPAAKSMATVIASDSFGFTMGRPDGGTMVVPRPAAIIPITGAESYASHTDNAFLRVADNPLSTFSADIDTASYTNVRRF